MTSPSSVYHRYHGRESLDWVVAGTTADDCRIPEREYEIRKDLRSDRVFTIDPASAKDLDDALSIKKNEDGSFDVNVHIADVTYFGKSLSPTSCRVRS